MDAFTELEAVIEVIAKCKIDFAGQCLIQAWKDRWVTHCVLQHYLSPELIEQGPECIELADQHSWSKMGRDLHENRKQLGLREIQVRQSSVGDTVERRHMLSILRYVPKDPSGEVEA